MAPSYKLLADKAFDFWLARGAVLVIVILQVVIVNDLTVGPRWLAPVLELTLLIPLSIATAWTQRHARKATTDEQWHLVGRQRLMVRRLAISLTALVTSNELRCTGALGRSHPGGSCRKRSHAAARCTQYMDDQCHHLRAVVLGARSR